MYVCKDVHMFVYGDVYVWVGMYVCVLGLCRYVCVGVYEYVCVWGCI